MKSLNLIVSTLSIASFACTAEIQEEDLNQDTGEIIAGTKGTLEDRQVVQIRMDLGGGRFASCSGTMLTSQIVATARHCVSLTDAQVGCRSDGTPTSGGRVLSDLDATKLGVLIYNATGSRSQFSVKEVIRDTSKTLCNADFALIVLQNRVTNVKTAPIRLAAAPKKGELLKLAGYGLTEKGTSGSLFTRSGVAITAAGATPSLGISSKEIAFGEGICSGDSGGPAFSQSTGALLAVTSRGGGGDGGSFPKTIASGCIGKNTMNIDTQVFGYKKMIEDTAAKYGQKLWYEGQAKPALQ